MIKKFFNNIKIVNEEIFKPDGINPEWDDECKNSFYRFLNILSNLFIMFYLCICIVSIYFLFSYG